MTTSSMVDATLDEATLVNALTIDVEGFVESNRQSFEIPSKYIDSARENYEVQTNVTSLLALLDSLEIRATFFFLGRIGRDLPELVREVAQQGHEIGSHSYDHLRVHGMGADEFAAAAARSKMELEAASGTPVLGFRAPDFSIGSTSMWALDALHEAGFAYDSSLFPIAGHDVYGVAETLPTIHLQANGLVEFPLATASLLGRRIPFGGGGYFRLYPLSLTSRLMRGLNRMGQPCMFYIHPYEVGPVIPTIAELSRYRRFRHYWGCKNGARRLRRLLQKFRFAPALDVLRSGGWLKV